MDPLIDGAKNFDGSISFFAFFLLGFAAVPTLFDYLNRKAMRKFGYKRVWYDPVKQEFPSPDHLTIFSERHFGQFHFRKLSLFLIVISFCIIIGQYYLFRSWYVNLFFIGVIAASALLAQGKR